MFIETLCATFPLFVILIIVLAMLAAAWLRYGRLTAFGLVTVSLVIVWFLGLDLTVQIASNACGTWSAILMLALLLGLMVLGLQYRRQWLARIPLVAALLVLILGGALTGHVFQDESAFSNIYRTLQLFAGQADWTQDQILDHSVRQNNALLVNVTHLVRLLGILAAFSLIVSLFRNLHGVLLQLSSRLLSPNKRIILCGLGEIGMQFVEAYDRQLARQSKCNIYRWIRNHYRLFIIEQDPNNPHIETCLERGHPVLVRDVFDLTVQLRSRIHRAEYVIHALPNDTRNVELAISIRNMCEGLQREANKTALEPPKLLIHVDDPNLARRAEDTSRLGSEQRTETRFFNLYESSARKVLAEHGPDWYADTANAAQVHIALYGYNAMAEALLEQAVKLCHFDHDAPTLRISLFDSSFVSAEGRSAFLQRYPRNEELASRVEFRLLPVAARQFIDQEALHECARAGVESMSPPTQHFVCFDDDAFATRFSLALRDLLRDQSPVMSRGRLLAWNAPVFIRLKHRGGLARMFDVTEQVPGDPGSRMESPDNLHAFGMLDDMVQYRELLEERRDALARTFHEQGYRSVRNERSALNAWRKASDVNWEHLSLFLKQSNRAQADHVRVKLRALRCVDASPSSPSSRTRNCSSKLIEQAAREAEIQSEPVLALQFLPELKALVSVHGKLDLTQEPSLVVRRYADNRLLAIISEGKTTPEDSEKDYRGKWDAKESCWHLTTRETGNIRIAVNSLKFFKGVRQNQWTGEPRICGKLHVKACPTASGTGQQVVLEQKNGQPLTVDVKPKDEGLITALAVHRLDNQKCIVAVGWENGCVQAVELANEGQRQLPVSGPWHRLLQGHQSRSESAWERLARLEHDRWNATHWIGGWRCGAHRVDPAHVHDDLLSWEEIKPDTRSYDRKGIGQLPFLLSKATGDGKRVGQETVCRQFMIGVTAGVRGSEASCSDGNINLGDLTEEVTRLHEQAKDVAQGLPIRFVVASSLTDGPERQVVKTLVERLDADLIVTLPLPFELFYMDFCKGSNQDDPDTQAQARWRSVQKYAQLVARSLQYVELPMRFGNLEALGTTVDLANDPAAYQQTPHYQQYQLGDAWLVQRCDALVCVDRPAAQAGAANLDEVVQWRRGESDIPETLQWDRGWFVPPAPLSEPVIVSPEFRLRHSPSAQSNRRT